MRYSTQVHNLVWFVVPLAKAVKGLRKLDTLIGWKVVMKDSGVDVGVVDDVSLAGQGTVCALIKKQTCSVCI